MSNKVIKAALKAAKGAIQKKDYDEALDQSKIVLEEDPRNYNALVFVGVCNAEFGKYEDSAIAYQDAIKVGPDQPLAYQGLINLYTKHKKDKLSDNENSQLVTAYKGLILLTESSATDSKALELFTGLASALCALNQYADALEPMETLYKKLKAEEFDAKHEAIYTRVVEVVKHAEDLKLDRFSEMMIQSTMNYCKLPSLNDKNRERALLSLLRCCESNPEVYENVLKCLVQLFLSGEFNLTSLMHDMLIQIKLQTELISEEDQLKEYTQIASNVESPYINIFCAYNLFKDLKYEECKARVAEGLQNADDFIPAWRLLAKVNMMIHQYKAAEETAKSGLQKCKQINVDQGTWVVRVESVSELKLDLSIHLATSMSYSTDIVVLNQSIGTFNKLLKLRPTPDVHMGLTRAAVNSGNVDLAKSTLDLMVEKFGPSAEVETWKAYLLYQEGKIEDSISKLQKITEAHPNCFQAHLMYGKLMWGNEVYRTDKTKCFTTFLKAAKLDIYDGETFYYLGLFYRDVEHDHSRATKCLQKTVAIDPQNELAGSALADLYIAHDNIESAVDLYEKVTHAAPSGTCKWAWMRLGLCKLRLKDAESAIKSFLAALRCDLDDHLCWDCLGEAYILRGSYGAALKSFTKSQEIQPTSIFSAHQMAAVKQLLGEHSAATEVYEQVLEIDKDYVPALKGISECYYALANSMISDGRDLTCVDQISLAMKYLATAVTRSPDISCLWKLIADCLTCLHPIHESNIEIHVPLVLLDRNNINEGSTRVMGKLESLQLGGKFYLHAIRLSKSTAPLWYDVGMNDFRQAQYIGGDSGINLAEKCSEMLKVSLSQDAENHVVWNSLGAVSASNFIQNPGLAQHCFITSINMESNNARAWSNLATLYLVHDQMELAHKAYKVAQSLDPSFVNSWIGQAIIAGRIGSGEAIDLFRHSTELGLNMQAGCGYSSWVCNVLYECEDRSNANYVENIHGMDAITAAIVQMTKYCDRNPNCPHASTLLGYLLEESGLFPSAEKSYKKSLEILQADPNNEELMLKIDRAKSNYARLLYTNCKYAEAISAYNSMQQPNHKDLCMLALALHNAGNLKDSLTTLEKAKALSTEQKELDQIKIAQAIILTKLRKVEEAKTMLKEIENSRQALQVLCSIELNNKNKMATTSALDDLHTMLSCDTSAMDVYNLLSIGVSVKHHISNGHKALQRYIHRFPDNWRSWELMARLLLTEVNNMKSDVAYSAAAWAWRLYQSDKRNLITNYHRYGKTLKQCADDRWKVAKMLAYSTLACGKHSSIPGDVDALKAAQRLVHSHPYNAESWSILSSACHARTVYTKITKNETVLNNECRRFSEFVANHSSDKLHAWATKQNMLSCIIDHEHEAVAELASKITINFEESDVFVSLSECDVALHQSQEVEGHVIDELENLAFSQSTSLLSKKMLSSALQSMGMYERSHKVLVNLLKSEPNNKFNILLRITHLGLTAAATGYDITKWIEVATNASIEAVKLNGNSPVALLLDALCHKANKNNKKMKSSLHKALTTTPHPMCQAKLLSACLLYNFYQEQNDDVASQELVEDLKGSGTEFWGEIQEILLTN